MYYVTWLEVTNCLLVSIDDTKDNTNDVEDDSEEQLQWAAEDQFGVWSSQTQTEISDGVHWLETIASSLLSTSSGTVTVNRSWYTKHANYSMVVLD